MIRDRLTTMRRGLLLGPVVFFLLPLGAANATASSLLAPGQEIAPEVRERLREVSADPTLETWQREFMVRLVQEEGNQESEASFAPELKLPGASLATTDGSWDELTPSMPPSRRSYHTAIYDPVRGRMVVFGGNDESDRNDVWALTLSGSPVWTQLFPSGMPPSARFEHTSIYDPVRDRMVVFAGVNESSTFFNDVWALTLSATRHGAKFSPAGCRRARVPITLRSMIRCGTAW